jgi:hypothetical protein
MPRAFLTRAIFALPLLLAACGTAAGPQPSATATQTATPTVRPSATATPGTSPSASPVACDTTVSGKGTVAQAQIVDIRVAAHGDYDRIVFEFTGRGGAAGVPDYEIKTAARPIYKDPSGLPLTIAGDPVFGITLRGGTRQGLDGTAVYKGPTVFKTNYATLSELAEGGDFEAIATWYAGLSGSSCVSAQVLADPARLVIDVTRR